MFRTDRLPELARNSHLKLMFLELSKSVMEPLANQCLSHALNRKKVHMICENEESDSDDYCIMVESIQRQRSLVK